MDLAAIAEKGLGRVDGTTIEAVDGARIELGDIPEGADTAPVQTALVAVLAHAVKRQDITGNARLSSLGQAEELTAALATTQAAVTEAEQQVPAAALKLDEAEATRYAPPVPRAETVQELLYDLLRDREIRDVLRGQSPTEQQRFLASIREDAVEAEALAAVLRDPLGGGSPLTVSARAAWRELVDRKDPDGRQALDRATVAVEWQRRVLARIAGRLKLAR